MKKQVLLGLGVVLGSILLLGRAAAMSWDIDIVDSDLGIVHPAHSLALDSDGNAHMSYNGGYNLRYAHYHNHSKQITTVDKDCLSNYSAIALDGEDNPHISYITDWAPFWATELRYARWDGSSWVIEQVDANLGYAPGHTALAVGEDGVPHIAYYSYSGYELRYAHKGPSGWITQTLDNDVGLGGHTSMTLDSQGNVHLTYFDEIDRAVHHAYQGSDTWYIETIEGGLGYNGGHTSLALDDQDHGHASYYDDEGKCVKYAWQGADGWHPEVVECDIGFYGGHTGLALDSDDHPHISYYSGKSTREIKYAYRRSSSWHIEVVDTVPGAYDTCTAIDVDGDSRPHLTFQNYDAGDLRYARGAPEAVHAMFIASPTSGFAPSTVVFTNTSTGDYITSLWSFGDQVTSSLESPTHTYMVAGTYTVTLMVSGPGGTDTLARAGCITVQKQGNVYLPLVLRLYVTH